MSLNTLHLFYTGQLPEHILQQSNLPSQEFDCLQDDLGALFEGGAGAAQKFVAQMKDTNRHPDRAFALTFFGNDKAMGKNPFVPEGMCCAVLLDIVDGQIQVTASKGNDWIAVQAEPTLVVQYSFFDRDERNLNLVEFPEDQRIFKSPIGLNVDVRKPENTDKPFVEWLARAGQTPERVGLKRGNQPFLTNNL